MSLNVLELFSGIGGMHFALKEAGINANVVAAIDISDVPNKVYRHNFPSANHLQSNICGLTAKKLNSWHVQCILMSPPCQPFTRQGNQKGLDDPRTQPLVHILGLVKEMKELEYVLVENVKGFETSSAQKLLLKTLSENDFSTKEFLLSPSQLGIPNSRLRYFLIARKKSETFNGFDNESEICTDVKGYESVAPDVTKEVEPLDRYLEEGVVDGHGLSDATLLKYAEVLDIVTRESKGSCCFTKAYGQYAEGTGSILQQSGDLDSVYQRFRLVPKENQEERLSILNELKLRYFSPREISKLMGFPGEFSFPEETTTIQRYRCLGNSLNVAVVAFLIKIMMK